MKKYLKLRAEMVLHSETSSDLSKIIGISSVSLINKLNGKTPFTITEIEKICEHYQKGYYDLFQ